MSNYDFMKFSDMTRKIIKEAKLGDAVYTILEVAGSICKSCSQIEKTLAIKKVYVGRIEESVDNGRRLSLYEEASSTIQNSVYGISAFYPVAVAFYGTGAYIALNQVDLLPELKHQLDGTKELNEYRVKRDKEEV